MAALSADESIPVAAPVDVVFEGDDGTYAVFNGNKSEELELPQPPQQMQVNSSLMQMQQELNTESQFRAATRNNAIYNDFLYDNGNGDNDNDKLNENGNDNDDTD